MRGDDKLLAAAWPLSVDHSGRHAAALPLCPQRAPASSSNPGGKKLLPKPTRVDPPVAGRRGVIVTFPVRVRIECVQGS